MRKLLTVINYWIKICLNSTLCNISPMRHDRMKIDGESSQQTLISLFNKRAFRKSFLGNVKKLFPVHSLFRNLLSNSLNLFYPSNDPTCTFNIMQICFMHGELKASFMFYGFVRLVSSIVCRKMSSKVSLKVFVLAFLTPSSQP